MPTERDFRIVMHGEEEGKKEENVHYTIQETAVRF